MICTLASLSKKTVTERKKSIVFDNIFMMPEFLIFTLIHAPIILLHK